MDVKNFRAADGNSGFPGSKIRLLPLLCLLWAVPTLAAADLGGVVFTVSADRVRTVWPNARVTLISTVAAHAVSTVSNHLGQYAFTGLLPGDYQVQVELAGFKSITQSVRLDDDKAAGLDIQLTPMSSNQTIEVTAESPSRIDLSSSSGGAPVLTETLLKSAVRLSEDFQEALPLLPGVLRGPDGLLRIKGGRTSQTNALVNTASIADPFTGQPALRLPAVAVESVRVLSNPFSAEYGGFASGVVEVTTRGGTDRWKWLFEDPVPRLRWIGRRTHGIESASPHLVFSGPLLRNRLYLFQSTSYHYDTYRIRSLPDPDNVRVEKGFNTHTQLDWELNADQRLTAVLTTDPGETDFANINTFNPSPVAADFRRRGFFAAATHRRILASGGFLQSAFSAKRLDARVFPACSQAAMMVLFPEGNSGTFFDRQDRRTRLYQWSQSLHLAPTEAWGRHLFTVGYSFARAADRGSIYRLPVSVLRGDGTRSQEIGFGKAPESDVSKTEMAVFVQDGWQIHPRLLFDLGVRLQTDSLSAEAVNAAPRAGFVFAPARDDRTAIRGGVGVFFDKIPLNLALFKAFPQRTVTRFAADGVTVLGGPVAFSPVVATADGRLRVPFSIGWSLQFDRQLRRGLLFRFGYEQRKLFRDFYVDPYNPDSDGAELRLLNSGRQSYREFLWMLRWQASARTTLFASYVRSHAFGESNDYNQFFGDFSNPLIRPNQRSLLSHDAPDRFLFWGVIGLPRKLEFVPVVDLHSGFPYSKLDRDWNYVGQRNEAGRFPAFAGIDVKLQYPFDFRFRRWHFKFRAGLKVFNVLNRFNPRDVQQYAASNAYGTFYNPLGRVFRLEGDFDF